MKQPVATLQIGILALQGAFSEHIRILTALGATTIAVRQPEQLDALDGLIIPGGESTAIGLIAERWGLLAPLREFVRSGKPVWGLCAGMIMLADRLVGHKAEQQPLIGGLDVTVARNYFGRQKDSFEAPLDIHAPELKCSSKPAIFIRAPVITQVGLGVEVLATLQRASGEQCIVAVRQGNLLATAFHPELGQETAWHQYFLKMGTHNDQCKASMNNALDVQQTVMD